MEKFFLPFVIVALLLSTTVMMAVGQDFISKHPDQEICVESRSCAINWQHSNSGN
jgi:hypothetical protein